MFLSKPIIPLASAQGEGISASEVENEIEVSKQSDLECPSFFEGKKPLQINCLPQILQKCLSVFESNLDKDLVLLGSLTAISAVLPNYISLYAGKIYHPNLNVNIIANYGSGKGVVDPCRHLVKAIDDLLSDEISDRIKNETHQKSLFIEADSSGAAMKKQLFLNHGLGLIWETEGIGLVTAASQDWGKDIPVMFLRACEHEEIASNRSVTGKIKIENPQLSSLLAFVPSGIGTLLQKESGSFSRMLYYLFDPPLSDIDPFAQKLSYKTHFKEIGKSIVPIYKYLRSINELDVDACIYFSFSENQQAVFKEELNKLRRKMGKHWAGIIPRLYVQYLRICMIFSILEDWQNNDCQRISPRIICSNNAALLGEYMIEILLEHMKKMYSLIPKREKTRFSAKLKAGSRAETLFNALPAKFKTSEVYLISDKMEISRPSVTRYLKDYVDIGLTDYKHGQYLKT
jgi:Protein of unknown function (DUF3987)